jgi:cytochrome c oxidase assembly factor CtaG
LPGDVTPTVVAAVGIWGTAVAAGVVYRSAWRVRHARGLVGAREAISFGAGLAALALALGPPLDDWSAELLSAHMVQHLLLGLVAPFLLAGGQPGRVLGPLAPPELSRLFLRWRHRPVPVAVGAAAVLAHVGAFWLWHTPALYDAAVRHVLLHVFEHATLFLGGCALVVVTSPRRLVSVLYLFGAALGSGVLGALLAFSGRPWYDAHLATAGRWGLTPLQDQQAAGTIMWVPGGMVYTALALVVFVRWFQRPPSPLRRHDVARLLAAGRDGQVAAQAVGQGAGRHRDGEHGDAEEPQHAVHRHGERAGDDVGAAGEEQHHVEREGAHAE